MVTGGRGKGKNERLDSIDALRRRVPLILKRLNDEPTLALRAAANPLLVLQEMGIELTDRLAAEAALRLRFRPEQIAHLESLRVEIHESAGEVFDVDDPIQLHQVLFDRLKLSPLPPAAQPVVIAQSQVATEFQSLPRHELDYPWTAPGRVRRPDPLEQLRDAHPVLNPLLTYRALQASQPPLASSELAARLASGEVALPKIRIRARLQRGAIPE